MCKEKNLSFGPGLQMCPSGQTVTLGTDFSISTLHSCKMEFTGEGKDRPIPFSYVFVSVIVDRKLLINKLMQDSYHGVQHRMISVVNFFSIFRLFFFALLLLYVT